MRVPSFISEPQVRFLYSILEEIRDGHIQVPRFQRPFVWTAEKELELLNSIRDGLPVGALMVWRTQLQGIACYERLGPYALKPPATGEGAIRQYLLDGVQRMTTLYKAFFPPSVEVEEEGYEGSKRAYLDLNSGEFVWLDEPYSDFMPLDVVFDTVKYSRFMRRLPEKKTKEIETAEEVVRAFREYKVPIIPIVSENLDIATLTFQRINSQGTPMSTKHMVHALTWSATFDLQARIESLKAEHLEPVGWAGVEDERILDACSLALGLRLFDRDVDQLSRRIKRAPEVIEAVVQRMRRAADFLREECSIGVPDIVPYKEHIALLTEAFQASGAPSETARAVLRAWVWLSTYGSVFAGSSLKRLVGLMTEDVRRMTHDGKPRWPKERGYERSRLPPGLDVRTARAKALAVRLAEQARSSAADKAPVDLLAARGMDAVRRLFPDVRERFRGSPGNYFLVDQQHLGLLRVRLRSLAEGAELAELRRAHFVSDAAFAFLRAGRYEDFIDQRRDDLDGLEASFVAPIVELFKNALPSEDA